MAEHMLILELGDPTGGKTYFAGAFPSACGKTNLAMLESPLEHKGYTVRTVGDDIAWMHIGPDGRLWAINPEAGFFGVVPGTSMQTNANALLTARSNSIYTNVAVDDNGIPWWEGKERGALLGALTRLIKALTAAQPEPRHPPQNRLPPARRQNPAQSRTGRTPKRPIYDHFGPAHTPLTSFRTVRWQLGTLSGDDASQTKAAARRTVRRAPARPDDDAAVRIHMGDYFGNGPRMGRHPRPDPAVQVKWFRRTQTGTTGPPSAKPPRADLMHHASEGPRRWRRRSLGADLHGLPSHLGTSISLARALEQSAVTRRGSADTENLEPHFAARRHACRRPP
jgi:phosphoenolpyruvate carboxykinase (GTP)